MAEAITIHKSQGRSEKIVTVDVQKGMNRQKYYVAFSRATTLNGLHIIGKFNPPDEIKADDPVQIEMARLRNDPFIPKFQVLREVPENVIQIISHNVQSIRKHISSIVADTTYTNSQILVFQESWAINNESYNIPEFEEISRNSLSGRPRPFGTINFCKSSMESRITNRIEFELENTNNHLELTGFCVDNKLTIINIYNSPASNLNVLKEAFAEIKTYIEMSDTLVIGDFNHQFQIGNQFEKFLKQEYNLSLLSPREPTTNAGTTIDYVFGKLLHYEATVSIYESYFSFHRPIVIRIKEK